MATTATRRPATSPTAIPIGKRAAALIPDCFRQDLRYVHQNARGACCGEKRADEVEQQFAEYRQQVEEERRQRAEEHRLWMEETRRLLMEIKRQRWEDERRRADEEWRTMMQQNAELHRAMLAALTELTATIVQLRQERNSNGLNRR